MVTFIRFFIARLKCFATFRVVFPISAVLEGQGAHFTIFEYSRLDLRAEDAGGVSNFFHFHRLHTFGAEIVVNLIIDHPSKPVICRLNMINPPEDNISSGLKEKIEPIENTSESFDSKSINRSFERDPCDISLALTQYINTCDLEAVNTILARLFSVKPAKLGWYMMQLIHLYLFEPSAHELIFDHLCLISSVDLKFSLLCTWFLEACLLSGAQAMHSLLSPLRRLINAILMSYCEKKDNYSMPLFVAERSFVTELVLISKRLRAVTTKISRTYRLRAELLTLDRSLSRAVYIPIISLPDHVVVRIPFRDSSVLNSKDKTPYLMYVEVIERHRSADPIFDVNLFKQEEFKKFIKSYKQDEVFA